MAAYQSQNLRIHVIYRNNPSAFQLIEGDMIHRGAGDQIPIAMRNTYFTDARIILLLHSLFPFINKTDFTD
jgi:hypothetical protein